MTEPQRALYQTLLVKVRHAGERVDLVRFRVDPAMCEYLNMIFVFYKTYLKLRSREKTLNARSVRYTLALGRGLHRLLGRGRG